MEKVSVLKAQKIRLISDNLILKHGFQNYLNRKFLGCTERHSWTKFAGKFWTSAKHTSHFLFRFVLNHLI